MGAYLTRALLPKAGGLACAEVAAWGVEIYRLIHDLKRSRVNRKARVPERSILPRLRDAVEACLRVVRSNDQEQQVELLVCDFKDAFKQLHVHPDDGERRRGTAREEDARGRSLSPWPQAVVNNSVLKQFRSETIPGRNRPKSALGVSRTRTLSI